MADATPGITLGLERVQALLHHLGDPHLAVPVIHVAGTNGKGSVCAYLEHVLRRAGWRVGLFTSPHLLHPADAIRVDGRSMEAVAYAEALRALRELDGRHGIGASPFELETALTFQHWRRSAVDLAILEVGVGGRLDATNVCRPLACVFVSIGMDHQALLGPTLEAIAREKAGIIKGPPGVPVIVGPQQAPHQVLPILEHVAAAHGCPVHHVQPAQPVPGEPTGRRVTCVFAGARLGFRLPLLGDHQLGNVATAIRTLEALELRHPRTGEALSPVALCQGLEETQWPGRMEWIRHPSLGRVLVDGAHNVPAAQALGRYVHGLGRPVWWILAFSEGKDVPGILRCLVRPGDRLSVVSFPAPTGMPWVRAVNPATVLQEHVPPEVRDRLAHSSAYPSLAALCAEERGGPSLSPTCGEGAPEDARPVPSHLPVLAGSLYLVAIALGQAMPLAS